jgi:hypothetical protein
VTTRAAVSLGDFGVNEENSLNGIGGYPSDLVDIHAASAPLPVTWWWTVGRYVPPGREACAEWLNAERARVDDSIVGYAASSRSKNER